MIISIILCLYIYNSDIGKQIRKDIIDDKSCNKITKIVLKNKTLCKTCINGIKEVYLQWEDCLSCNISDSHFFISQEKQEYHGELNKRLECVKCKNNGGIWLVNNKYREKKEGVYLL